MRALSFHFSPARLAAGRILGSLWPGGALTSLGPVIYEEIPDPGLRGDRWVLIDTRYCGICGSDLKQVFLEGAMDNPMASLISFPHVMGHEIVGTVVETGTTVSRVRAGDRVACYPWLSCEPRGLTPCPACEAGRFTQCSGFTSGDLAPGIHLGNCRDLPGGFAPRVSAHESMCFVLPDSVSFEDAALADPFAVSLHTLCKAPPAPGQRVIVVGCGVLGLLLIQLLSRFHPDVEILGVDLHEHIGALAKQMGAHRYTTAAGAALVEEVAVWVGASPRKALAGLPWLLDGVDCVYDTVGSARTLETAVRIVRPEGTVVLVGVDTPRRFEWTPLYFKEVRLIGASGYGIEELDGTRAHAFDIYLSLLSAGRLDPAPLVTHRFPLDRYREAFLVARGKRRHRSVKVLFDFAAPAS